MPADSEPIPQTPVPVAEPPTTEPTDLAPSGFDLVKAIRQKCADKQVSIRLAAEHIGISVPTLKNILGGRARPNSSTAKKLARWLSIKERVITGKTTEKPGPVPAKALVRKPKVDLPPVFEALTQGLCQTAQVEIPPIPDPIMDRPAHGGLTTHEVLAIVKTAIENAQAEPRDSILDDKLARWVHEAPPRIRNVFEAMLIAMAR